MAITAEKLLTSAAGFGLGSASPVQRAICRVADGLPLGELAADANVQKAFGATVVSNALEATAALAGTMPEELYIIAAIRSGKSLLSAVLGLRSAFTADMAPLGPGEIPVVSILSLNKRLGKFVFRHLLGALRHGSALKPFMVGEPRYSPEMSLTVRHPSGRLVEITVVAGAKAGSSLIASWSAGAIFDEVTRMQGAKEGVVNFEDARDALADRMLPGAQLVGVGSPWAPSGPIYDTVNEFWGRPCRHVVVIRAPGPVMNPSHWTPERVEKARTRPNGERAYRTSCLGEFADSAGGLLSEAEVTTATRLEPEILEYDPNVVYCAAMDPATRRNAWSLVIVGRYTDYATGKAIHKVARVRQWNPTAESPLQAEIVIREIAAELRTYKLGEVYTDQWSSDTIAALGRDPEVAIDVIHDECTAAERTLQATGFRDRLQQGGVELPSEPDVRRDLLGARLLTTRTGLAVEYPKTSDGRHCDYAPACFIASALLGDEPEWLEAMKKWRERGRNW